MVLERLGAQHEMAVVDKFVDPIATYEMTTRDYVMRPTVVAAAIIITLPPVSLAKGRFYSFAARGNVSATLPVTIQDHDDSEYWEGDIILLTLKDALLLYSDGIKWMLRSFADVTVAAGPSHNRGIRMGETGGHGTTINLGTVTNEWHGIEMSVTADWNGEYANGVRVELEDLTGTAGSMLAGRFDVVSSFDCATLNGVNATVQLFGTAQTISGRIAAGYISLYGHTGNTITRASSSIYGLFVQHYLRSDPGDAANPAGAGGVADFYNAGIGLSMPNGTYCDYGIVIKGETNGTIAAILIGPHGTTTWESGIRFKNGSPGDADAAVAGGVTSAIYFDTQCPVVNLCEWEATGYATSCVDVADAITCSATNSDGAIRVNIAGAAYFIPIYAVGSGNAGP